MILYKLLFFQLFLAWCNFKVLCNENKNIKYTVVLKTDIPNAVVGVAIGKDVYPLQADSKIPLMYSGQGPSETPYRYVILDSTKKMVDYEKFERPAILHSKGTFNEVYGRPWNKLMLPQLPSLNQDFTLGTKRKDPGENKLYEDGTIANLIFEADDQIVQSMHAEKKQKAKVTGRLTYISYNHVEQFDDVELKIGGHSSRDYAKVPYKLKISPEKSPKGLFNRWELKLRPEATDPTLLREKLYTDILQSVGVLGPRGGYVRFYLNSHTAGLFLLTDDIANKEYVRETIHDGNQKAQIGGLIKGDAGKGDYAADLGYRGDEPENYDEKTYEVEAEAGEDADPMEDLIAFMKFIKDYPVDNNADEQTIFDEWNQKINIKHFIRQIAVEWLTGNWDAHQYSGNNYVIYQHPTTKQFITLPMDFDYTFGNGLEQDQGNLLVGKWTDFTSKRKTHSYLWEKLADINSMQRLYLDTVNEINEKVTKPEVILPRLESLAYLIQHDAQWDKNLDRLSDGKFRQWPNDDYLQSLEQGSGAQDENIGLKEWIRAKYDAVSEYSNSLDNLPVEEKKQLYSQNAKMMKGIPPQEFEKMQEAEAMQEEQQPEA